MILPDWIASSPWFRRGLQAAAVVVVIAIIGGASWAWWRSKEAQGLAALSAATEIVDQAQSPQANPEVKDKAIKALESLLAEYPRLSAAPQVAYQIGNLKYSIGQYIPARSAYELALAKGASGSVQTLCRLGIGYTWEGEKNYAGAISAYEAALKALTARDFLYDEILMSEARAQELGGKPGAAIEIYQRLLKEAPTGRYADDLKNRIASLQSR